MTPTEADGVTGRGGFGFAGTVTAEIRPGQGYPIPGAHSPGIAFHLHCTGCSTDVPEQDVFEITGYRPDERGHDEVSFICPFCGSASTSLRRSGV